MGELFISRRVAVLRGCVSLFRFWGLVIAIRLVFNMGFPLSGGMLGELELFYSLRNV